MDFYYGLAQIIGVHTLLGLSAYIVLLTGQVSLAQAGFFAIGAYASAMLTVLAGWPLVPALGAGGLIRAYGGVVGEALDELGTVTRRRYRLATVTVDHQRAGKTQNDLRSTGRTVVDLRYGASVEIEVALPEADLPAFEAWLADSTAGTAQLTLGGETYAP